MIIFDLLIDSLLYMIQLENKSYITALMKLPGKSIKLSLMNLINS